MLDDKEEFNKLQNDIYALSKDGDTKSRRVHERQEDDMHHKICALITIAAGYSIEPDNEINFNDVEGCVDVKKELRDLVGLATLRLTQPSLFRDRHYDRKRQNVIILGPPGVGKTMLGKAFANERGAKLFYLPSTSLARLDVWEKRRLLMLVVEAAYAMTPSVIFLDEEAGAPLSSLLNNYSPGCEGLATFIKADWKEEYDVTFIASTSQPHSFDEWALNRLSNGGSNAITKCYYIPSPDLPVLYALLPSCAPDEALNELARKTNEVNYYDDLHQLLKKARKKDERFIDHADMCVHLKAMSLLREPRTLRSGRQL